MSDTPMDEQMQAVAAQRETDLAELLKLFQTLPSPVRLPDLWNKVSFRSARVIGYVNELRAAGHDIETTGDGYVYRA